MTIPDYSMDSIQLSQLFVPFMWSSQIYCSNICDAYIRLSNRGNTVTCCTLDTPVWFNVRLSFLILYGYILSQQFKQYFKLKKNNRYLETHVLLFILSTCLVFFAGEEFLEFKLNVENQLETLYVYISIYFETQTFVMALSIFALN